MLREHRIEFNNRQVRLQTAALAEHASVVFTAVDATLRGTVRDVREGRDTEPADATRGSSAIARSRPQAAYFSQSWGRLPINAGTLPLPRRMVAGIA